MSGAITAVGVAAAGVATTAYEASKSRSQTQSIANNQLGLAQDVEGKQDYYNNQLQTLMADPSSFLNSTIFQSSLNQGLQGVSRQMASQGYTGSGNMATALEGYGQSQASGELFNQESILGNLSGAGAASTASGALQGASQTNSTGISQLGSLLASLGYGGKQLGGAATSLYNNGSSAPGGGIDYYSSGPGATSLVSTGDFNSAYGDVAAANAVW